MSLQPWYDPWFKAKLQHSALGARLTLCVPHDVFSTQRIDEGTLLLLEHLPTREPQRVLDMGCGYGALGLPIAARFPNARVEMVDRDLLAVKWSQENASLNGLKNVVAYPSLGFRDLRAGDAYDWILCNIPARIGDPFIENFCEAGRARLSREGELRIVVINDLCERLNTLKENNSWPLKEIAKGPRHTIFALSASNARPEPEPPDLYLRDSVDFQGMKLDRPFDLGGDDPKRLRIALPALIDAFPREFSGRALCFRSGYGQLPLTARMRWPDATIVATDRDLLATTYTRRNAQALGLGGESLEIRENAALTEAIAPGETFDLILGELSPSSSEKVVASELLAIREALAPRGQALILCLEKLEKEWIKPNKRLPLQPVLKREGYAVLLMRG